MQTTITNTMAFGFDGEHANGQPFRADAYVVNGSGGATFGQPVFADGVVDGTSLPKCKSGSGTYIGMAVGPHQHVKMELPSDSRTITVPQGTQIAVAARGCWFTSFESAVAVGDKIKVDAGKYVKSANGTNAVGTVVKVDDTGKRAIVRLGE